MTSTTETIERWEEIFSRIGSSIGRDYRSTVNRIADANPLRVLISTIISLRTRDEVTLSSSERLFSVAGDVAALAAIEETALAELIYPAGFYRTKARQIRKTCQMIIKPHGGRVPATREELMAFPGVGRKTANLVLGLAFQIPAICVDTHVHRIPNRIGWIQTRTPAESEAALEQTIPKQFWIPINEILVGFGRKTCLPVSPHCSRCPMQRDCRQIGVTRWR